MGQTVMMIDDDEVFLDELSEVLSTSGYDTVAVTDTKQAMQTAQEIRPSVILLDLKMPGKNGFELAFELKNRPGLGAIPVIAMSGFFRAQKIPLLELIGIRKCLAKPLNPLDVIWTIEETLGKQSPEAEGLSDRAGAAQATEEKKFLFKRFDDLLMEMAGDTDPTVLAEMASRLARLKDYKEHMRELLSRPALSRISKSDMDLSCAADFS